MYQDYNFFSDSGKTSISIVLIMAIVFSYTFFSFDEKNRDFKREVSADTANTSVTVNNTAPDWTVDAEEQFESSSSSPTSVGGAIAWDGTATDSNGDAYYLLICKTSSAPTANDSAPPTCNGGASNQWAVSSSTPSGSEAVASTTVLQAMAESNDWFAWICDANGLLAKCNVGFEQGSGSTASPFVVNHRPTFTVFTDDSDSSDVPGSLITWTTTASDADTLGGADTVKLFVCRSNDFTGSVCGAGGTYATSSFSASNPSASYTIAIPTQDKNWTAYGYVIDNHGLAATGGSHGTDSVLTVGNATPSVTAGSITINGGNDLSLSVAGGQTTGFTVSFDVVDNNSCLNSSSGNEISSALINFYRSDIGSAACDSAGEYNANYCYPGQVGTGTWNYSCAQTGGTCSGASDTTAVWSCSFPLWFVASPTDGSNLTDSTWFAEDWRAAASVSDDNSAKSSLAVGTSGKEVVSFLAFDLDVATISFGDLDPGQLTDPLVATSSFFALGNVGLDQTLYGTDMCPTYPSCGGLSTNTIPVTEQKYASSSVAYASAFTLQANPGANFELNILKSTIPSTPASKSNFWGIRVPAAITLSGVYRGVNTIIGVKGEAEQWE